MLWDDSASRRNGDATYQWRKQGEVRIIYGPSALRGRDVERALHLRLDALNGAGPDAALTGDFENPFTGP